MPIHNTTPKFLKPAKYRAWIEYCAAQGLDAIPAHSVTDNGCWALVTPIKPHPSGHIRITRRIMGKMYMLRLHTLSLLHSQAPSIWRAIDDIQADGARAMICHKPICGGNKACFNPNHLRLDTHAENVRDMQRDGGQVRGEAHGRAKLTETQVNAIRQEHSDGASQAALGRKYGVGESTIRYIVQRKSWAHSDGKLFT